MMGSKRDEIIQVVLDLTVEKGFDNLSYKDISDIIGIKKASIHYHFPYKVDLGLAICVHMESLYDELIQKIAKESSYQKKMQLYIMFYDPANMDNTAPYFSLLSSYNTSSVLMQEKLTQICDKEYSLLYEILKLGVESNSITISQSLDIQTITILSAIKGAYKYHRIMKFDYVRKVYEYFSSELKI